MLKQNLYLNTPVYLNIKHRQLVVTKTDSGEIMGQVSVEDLASVCFDHPQISISHYALQFLVSHEVVVVSCDSKHLPAGLMLPIAGHTLTSKRLKTQVGVSDTRKKAIWKQLVIAKITNQAKLLEINGANEPSQYLKSLTSQVLSGDTSNIEGRAAIYYWKHYLPQFERERGGAPPNNLLNYGYAILRTMVAREIVCSGLHPSLGLFHKNQYNPFCLADDLMEPYRPFVDMVVYEITQKTTEEALKEMGKEIKIELLPLSKMDVMMETRKSPMNLAVQQTVVSLVKCFQKEQTRLRLPSFV